MATEIFHRQEGIRGDDSKMILHAPPLFGNEKILVCNLTFPHHLMAIEIFSITKRLVPSFWNLKKIIPHFPSWATEEFWSPSNNVGVLNGD
jgi:hypothetical protein